MNQQGSGLWLAERVGLCTASRFKDAMAKLKTGKAAASRESYALQLVSERLTGQPSPTFVTQAMNWGTEQEPAARIEYAWRTGVEVEETGFHRHATLATGASPDGLVSSEGLCEFKAPSSQRHVETLLHGMPEDHLPQIMGQMWITGRAWVDFCSFDPRMVNKKHQLYIQRVYRDDAYIANLETEIRGFLGEVDALVQQIEESTK